MLSEKERETNLCENDFLVLEAFLSLFHKNGILGIFLGEENNKKGKKNFDAEGIKEFIYFTILWGIRVEK